MKESNTKKRTKDILHIIIFSILFIVILICFFVKLWFVPTLPVNLSSNNSQEKVYVVSQGETIDELANQLYKDKMVRSAHQLVSDFVDLQDKEKQNSDAPQQQANDDSN